MPPDFPFWCSPCERRWPNHAVSAEHNAFLFWICLILEEVLLLVPDSRSSCEGDRCGSGCPLVQLDSALDAMVHQVLKNPRSFYTQRSSMHTGNSQAFGRGAQSRLVTNVFATSYHSTGPLVAIKVGSNLFATSPNMAHLGHVSMKMIAW